MATPLLRSGSRKDFLALGESGQPVYAAALQLRETLRLRRQQPIADCLAVPQSNEGGDRIDWYSPIEGNVIPWSAASEEERASALSQLEQRYGAMQDLSRQMQDSEKPEHQLFGTLLDKALQFPDHSHVFLVDGKPVLTFWGFVTANHQSRPDPLDCLRPPVVAATPTYQRAPVLAATSTPTALPLETATIVRPWWHWRRFGWLSLLLLLLLLVPLLLRGCIPGVVLPSLSPTIPALTLPDGHVETPTGQAINTGGIPTTVTGVNRSGDGTLMTLPGNTGETVQGITDKGVLPLVTNDAETRIDPTTAKDPAVGDDPAATKDPTAGNNPTTAKDPAAGNDPTTAKDPAAGNDPTTAKDPAAGIDPTTAKDPAAGNDPTKTDKSAGGMSPVDPGQAIGKTPLTIPQAALKSGSTDFLNGSWQAGAGIQDQRTGKPLSLDYHIKDGKGTVAVTRGDGVTCRSDINTHIRSGGLAINNQNQAQCSDGSSYKMPEITCRPGAKSAADCTGRYDAKTVFPMTMKRGDK
ncbi:SrfA family protein [Acerihabitans sp. TG2]|uniref:SrfA family protein n=1 Tax=Acerihabitans sp. TG2 TaxID=3096008 RepID=UPI002B225F86|nr:SrfA family protein [Acerihabitans sp. TG2]MEA9391534.1 SrfA family protein [Acerihabitans sp. TG2]